MQIPNFEPVLSTCNTKLAATLSIFEIAIPKYNPGFLAEVFKLSDLRAGRKDPKPPRRVFWNIPDGKSREVSKAFAGKTAHADYDAFAATLGISQSALDKLQALHSASIAQACREVQEMHEKLVAEVKNAPDYALHQIILRDDGRVHAMFAKSDPPEVKAKFFPKS